MIIKSLNLKNFRNYKTFTIDFPNKGMVFEGLNGTGKTNILEAIFLLCTGRSQRRSKRAEMVNYDCEYSFIEGVFENNKNELFTVSMGFGKNKQCVLKIENREVTSFSDWFGVRPIISLSSNDVHLIQGSPDERRKFIDLTASLVDRDYLKILLEYKQILRQKNMLFHFGYNEKQCEIYDEQLSVIGVELLKKRIDVVNRLEPHFKHVYSVISDDKEKASFSYESSLKLLNSGKNEWKNVFYNTLCERRKKDKEYGFSSIGPHRDDLKITLNDRLARTYSSQGQCRSLALSIKLAASFYIEHYCSERLIFLVDDALSDLDNERAYNFFPLIENRGQLILAIPEHVSKNNIDLTSFKISKEMLNLQK